MQAKNINKKLGQMCVRLNVTIVVKRDAVFFAVFIVWTEESLCKIQRVILYTRGLSLATLTVN